MPSEAHKGNQPNSQDNSNCPNCHAQMPLEMRFCRACGCRLGEGIEEYTETVRLGSMPHTSPSRKPRTASAERPWTSPTNAKEFKAMANRIHDKTAKSLTSGLGNWKIGRACKRVPRWMVWVIVPIMIASMTSGLMSNSSSRRRARTNASTTASGSYLGSHYKTVDAGAFIVDVLPPGSAADKAGLVGGDVIISLDGKPIRSESDLSNLLTSTPVGKTVDVMYIRDGETKSVKLTTVSEQENGRLEQVFAERPEGKGFLGVDDDFKRVEVPAMNIQGVQLDDVYKNRPGYLAGLRDGDIVIEFGGVPIRTAEEFNMRIDRALPDSTVKVVVMRGGERLEILVKMGEE